MYITIVDYNQVVTNGQIDLSLFGKDIAEIKMVRQGRFAEVITKWY